MRILSAWALLVIALFPYAARGQAPVDACEPPGPIQALSPDRHTGIKLSEADRNNKIAKIREAMAQSPDDLFLNRWLIELQPKPQTGSLAAEFQEKLARRPDDPRYVYLYARALVGKDTPSAIQFLQKATVREPKLPWTYLALTEIYSSAAFRDATKVAENLRAYHKACPANLDAFAYLNVIEDEHVLHELADALRAQLQTSTGLWQLRYYSTLWAAEFRLAPPAELERAKKAVAEDLKRIEPLSQDDDPGHLGVLSDAYRLSGERVARRVPMHALRRRATQTRHSRLIRPGRKITPEAPGRRHTKLGPRRFTRLRPAGSSNGRITVSLGSSDAALW